MWAMGQRQPEGKGFIMRLVIGLIVVAALGGCMQKPDPAPKPSTVVDGIGAVLDRSKNPAFVTLDTTGSRERWETHKALGIRAAEELTGCKATHQPGTILDYIVENAKPVRIAVSLAC